MARRYLFLSVDGDRASGGVAVIYRTAAALRSSGEDVAILHQSPRGRYPFAAWDGPVLYTQALSRAFFRPLRPHHRLRNWAKSRQQRAAGGPNAPLRLRRGDVLVVPEMELATAQDAFPGVPKIVFVQNPAMYLEKVQTARALGLDPFADVVLHLSVSELCVDALELVGAEAVAPLRVGPELAEFPYREDKAPRVTYMPRKRPGEARLVAEALQRRGGLGGSDLRALDGAPPQEVARVLGESLVFLSFSHSESLGFPVMEAMAAGCLVVGYTGLGGREFFDDTTGYPVEEGDTMGLVRTVERVLDTYRTSPAPLDAIRKAASETIHRRYTEAAFRGSVQAAWALAGERLAARGGENPGAAPAAGR